MPLLPVTGEQRNVVRMHPANQELDRAQHRPGSDSQSVLEHPVVQVLDPDAREAMEDVDRLQDVAQIHHPDLPAALLFVGQRLERRCGGAMAAARIEEDQIDPRFARRRRRRW